jgi:hypothetical protein
MNTSPFNTNVCAQNCIGEVHMVAQCPAGIPNYRKGFDVYDASTGIEEDISKVRLLPMCMCT